MATSNCNLAVAICVTIFVLSTSVWADRDFYPGKKMIYFCRVPSVEYIRKNIREMEKVAFDGLVIPEAHSWSTWSKRRMVIKDLQPLIDNLRATKFRRFTDNFLPINSYFPSKEETADWFDPAWSAVADNAAVMARAAKQSRLKGIMFDTEQYGDYRMWDYDEAKQGRPFKEYRDKVQERGREFIRAINREFPSPVIFVTWSYELPIAYPHPVGVGGQPLYALLIPFLDGMIEAATPGTVLVDGYEYGYGFVSERAFMGGRKMIKDTARNAITSVPQAFDKHVRLGLPVYPDHWASMSMPFVFDRVETNLVTPDLFRTMLANALSVTDRYVWVYSERLRWWDYGAEFGADAPIEYGKANAPKEYVEALRLARKGPAPGNHPDKITWPNAKLELSKENWRFALDSTVGQTSAECVKTGYDDSSWQQVKLGETPSYTGKAWYRFRFSGPVLAGNMRAFLTVPTADEFARVWLNGEYVGEHDLNRYGYSYFSIEVSKSYKPGADNLLVLQMDNRKGASGITNPLKLSEAGYAQIQ
ncbi:MAG: hypothetical protein HY318_00700 [Armatimonadetes bacterium]|nr:hypothetical protein [Armatimonadota bacterium]